MNLFRNTDETAMISIDFLTAVGVLLIAFLFAVHALSSAMTPYSGYSKELYPTADRAATLLINDKGYWINGSDYGTNWHSVWYINQTYVKKIGLLGGGFNNSIDSRKLNVFLEKHDGISDDVWWWEYPTPSTDPAELDNVSRAMGLTGYNFYLQVRPINESLINVTEADAAAGDMVGGKGDVAAVTRLAMVECTIYGDFHGAYIFGHANPTKILIAIEPEDFDIIANGIEFSIHDWKFEGAKIESEFQWIKIGNELTKSFELKSPAMLELGEYNLSKNGIDVSTQDNVPFNSTDTLEFFIPISTLDKYMPDWDTSGNNIYIQLNVKANVVVMGNGVTYFDDSKKTIMYPVKMTLWIW